MYTLTDTFNDHVISRHRTLKAAVLADRRHSKAVKRANGPTSYIPTAIHDADGAPIREGHPEYDEYCRIDTYGA